MKKVYENTIIRLPAAAPVVLDMYYNHMLQDQMHIVIFAEVAKIY